MYDDRKNQLGIEAEGLRQASEALYNFIYSAAREEGFLAGLASAVEDSGRAKAMLARTTAGTGDPSAPSAPTGTSNEAAQARAKAEFEARHPGWEVS